MIYKNLLNKQKKSLNSFYTANRRHKCKKTYILQNYDPKKRPIKKYKSKIFIIFKNFVKLCNVLKNNFLILCYKKTNKYFENIINYHCYGIKNYKIKSNKKIKFKKNKVVHINIHNKHKNYIHNNVYEFKFINTYKNLEKLNVQYLTNSSYYALRTNIKENIFNLINEFITSINRSVVGQKDNIEQIARQLMNLNNEKTNKPIASYFLCGPSGTGKTEIAKIMTNFLYKKKNSLILKDMSTFSDSSSVSKLIGTAPGYIGHEEKGNFVDEILTNPNSLVLFDEIEKADKKVYSVFLQVLDEGVLTNSRRKVGYFNKSIIVFTSNLGSTVLKDKNINFYLHPDYIDHIQESIESHFAPEFINRLDSIIIFNPLDLSSLDYIFDKFIKDNNFNNINYIDNVVKYFTLFFSVSPNQGSRFLFYNINKFLLQIKLENNIVLRYNKLYNFLFN
ncbi:clpC1 (apicoplast) [Theileria orientalis]|uniref:ClpC1 n=1 Tax=Theileria orientalis TaxID=68886 RepID=A0A976SI52_THEOR|nr:clpC1 [Theileria orientalis]